MNVELVDLKFSRDFDYRIFPTWIATIRIQDENIDELINASFNAVEFYPSKDKEEELYWYYDSSIFDLLKVEDRQETREKIKDILKEKQEQIIKNEKEMEVPSLRTFRIDEKEEQFEVTFTLEEEKVKRYKLTIFPREGKWESLNFMYFNMENYQWEKFRFLVPNLSWEDAMYDQIVERVKKEKNLRIRHLFNPHEKKYCYRFYEERKNVVN